MGLVSKHKEIMEISRVDGTMADMGGYECERYREGVKIGGVSYLFLSKPHE